MWRDEQVMLINVTFVYSADTVWMKQNICFSVNFLPYFVFRYGENGRIAEENKRHYIQTAIEI
jgi:hypothetical protein